MKVDISFPPRKSLRPVGTGLRPQRRMKRGRETKFTANIDGRQAVSHTGIARSLRYISTNFSRPIRVRDLKSIAGLSTRGFLKAFRKHTGFRPGQVLRHMRIELAKRLLIESNLSPRQLAAQCGFRSPNSFGVAFRQVTGMAPKQFQQLAWLSPNRATMSRLNLNRQSHYK